MCVPLEGYQYIIFSKFMLEHVNHIDIAYLWGVRVGESFNIVCMLHLTKKLQDDRIVKMHLKANVFRQVSATIDIMSACMIIYECMHTFI